MLVQSLIREFHRKKIQALFIKLENRFSIFGVRFGSAAEIGFWSEMERVAEHSPDILLIKTPPKWDPKETHQA
jgi:hypothetical protein